MPKAQCVVHAADIKTAATLLSSSLHWSYTPEGHEFWARVTQRLTDWGNGKDPKESLADDYRIKHHVAIIEAQQDRIRELEASVLERDERIQKLGAKIIALDLASARFYSGGFKTK